MKMMKKQLRNFAILLGLFSFSAQAIDDVAWSVEQTAQTMSKFVQNKLNNDELRNLARQFFAQDDARTAFNIMRILALKDDSPFKRLGVEYILFSKNEPKLFQWLFMKKGIEVGSFKDFLPMRDYEYRSVIESIDEEYKISIENAKKFYEHLFIYSHGIATLTVTGIYNFTPSEIIEYMAEVAKSLIVQYLRGID